MIRQTVRQLHELGLDPLRRLAVGVALRHSPQSKASGLMIADLTQDRSGVALFPSVEEAVGLIRTYDPRRVRRLALDVSRIVLFQSARSAGEYWAFADAIALDVSHVAKQVVASVAMTIVHEATHARIEKAGIRYRSNVERIERRCVAEEIAFARLLPGSEGVIHGAHLKLESRWWEGDQQ